MREECGHVNDQTPFTVDPKDYLIQEMFGALQNALYLIEALEDNDIIHQYSRKERIKEVINNAIKTTPNLTQNKYEVSKM